MRETREGKVHGEYCPGLLSIMPRYSVDVSRAFDPLAGYNSSIAKTTAGQAGRLRLLISEQETH